MTFPRTLLLAALVVPALAACDSDGVDVDDDVTITDLVVADANLSTLEAAVLEAGLDGALAGDGPFTVFAPTDAAFAELLGALDVTAAELLARDDLADILRYHVVPGEFEADDLEDGQTLNTLNGQTLVVSETDGGFDLLLNEDDFGATLLATDIEASNGVVHTIGSVLIPSDD